MLRTHTDLRASAHVHHFRRPHRPWSTQLSSRSQQPLCAPIWRGKLTHSASQRSTVGAMQQHVISSLGSRSLRRCLPMSRAHGGASQHTATVLWMPASRATTESKVMRMSDLVRRQWWFEGTFCSHSSKILYNKYDQGVSGHLHSTGMLYH